MRLQGIKDFSYENGLCWDTYRRTVYGVFHGYHLVIAVVGKEYHITIAVTNIKPDSIEAFQQALSIILQKNPYCIAVNFANRTIKAGVKQIHGNDCEQLTQVLQLIIHECKIHSFFPCCRYCGSQTETYAYGINGEVDYLCSACANVLQEGQEGKKHFGNTVTGILGAVLGSFIGVFLWVIIYELGFIAGLAGVAMLVFALKGYALFGGKIHKAGILACIFISIFMIFVAENITVFIEVFRALRESYPGLMPTDLRFIAVIQTAWSEPELRTGMLLDLGMGYFLYLISSISYIRMMLIGTKKQKEFTLLSAQKL